MSASPTDRSATFVEMAKGTFTFWVAAVNAAGSGPRASVATTVTKGAPAPTSALSADTITAGDPVTISGTGPPTPGSTSSVLWPASRSGG